MKFTAYGSTATTLIHYKDQNQILEQTQDIQLIEVGKHDLGFM